MCGEKYNLLHWFPARSLKRSETLFKSLLFWLPGEVSWLAVEVLSPCQKQKLRFLKQSIAPFTRPWG